MRFHDIIWDFDGTLYASYGHMARSLQRALADQQVTPPMREIAERIRVTVPDAMRRYAEEYGLDIAALRAGYRQYQQVLDPTVLPFPGIPELLRQIVATGRRNHLYTHRNHLALSYLERDELLALFTGIVTSDCNLPPKPDGAGILEVLRQSGADPDRTVMVGDRELDILSGHNGGVAGCLFTPEVDHPDTCAEAHVYTAAQLQAFLFEE